MKFSNNKGGRNLVSVYNILPTTVFITFKKLQKTYNLQKGFFLFNFYKHNIEY